ncbi:MAG: hypothetical protein LBC82_01095 [Oscillospiraceae bacterium]|jgi:multiple sugar transport system permease protein|nr:hypothetical protein [Oscillospiraceae bacterium]
MNNNRNITRRIRENIGVYAIIAPFFLLFFAFLAVPFVMTLIIAFTDYKGAGTFRFVGFNNFIILFRDNRTFTGGMGNALITGLVGLVASVLLAWLITMLPKILRGVFAIALFAPFFTPLAEGKFTLGIGFLAILAGIGTIPHERYEAAAIEGIPNRVHEFIRITLPAIKPHLLFAAVIQLGAVIAQAAKPHEYTDVFEIGLASALCLVVFIPLLIIYFALRKFGRCWQD